MQLASEGLDVFLFLEAQKRLETEFDGFALCFESGSVEDVLHEGVINDDIDSHWRSGKVMCMSWVFITHLVKKFRRLVRLIALVFLYHATEAEIEVKRKGVSDTDTKW